MGAMSERPTLTISANCPTCGGTNRIPRKGHEGLFKDCPDCTDGTIRQAVSCAGCKWYGESNDPTDPTFYGWCMHDDMHAMDVLPDWGCLSWEAKA